MDTHSLLQDKRYLFWTLQFAGWSGWGGSFYLGVMVWGKAPDNYAIYLAVICSIGMVITLGMREIYHRMWNADAGWRFIGILLASYIGGLLWMSARATIFYNLMEGERKKHEAGSMEFFSYFDGAMSAFWVMAVWSGLYFGIKYYMLLQEEKQRGLKASAMAHEAQLKMLRYQLNPHFLFNTLNAISTLILDKDTQLANNMVTRLSRFLRYTLDSDPMERVSVVEEIEAIKLYLDIEKVRFDDRLRLHFDIEPEAETALVPSLLLQPLVENAIKYAIAQSINGGSIGISAKVFGDDLLLVVADDGPGLDLKHGRMPKGGGVGVSNCRERLKEIYNSDQSFRLSTTDPHGLTVSIRIPVTRAEKDE
ncbi:MAG: histidine kinase [Proteobacteria bacterium]|nr:histidine kinase [Pseudomonadota bacterium]